MLSRIVLGAVALIGAAAGVDIGSLRAPPSECSYPFCCIRRGWIAYHCLESWVRDLRGLMFPLIFYDSYILRFPSIAGAGPLKLVAPLPGFSDAAGAFPVFYAGYLPTSTGDLYAAFVPYSGPGESET
jgi:hypothetical protein